MGALIQGPIGGIVGTATRPIVEIGFDYSLGLLEEFVLEGLLEGKNPRAFVDKLKKEAGKNAT